jgi:hypothetical protein
MCLSHVERLGRDFDKALMHAWIAGTRYTQRRYHEALTHAGTAYAIAKEHNYQEWEATAGLMALLSQAALMPSSETATTALAAANAFKANGVCLNRSYFLWGIARAFMAAGDHAAALVTLDDASNAAEASDETRMNPEIWMLRAELEPDAARSRQLLTDAYELAIAQGAVANALRSAAIALLRDGDDRQRDWARDTLAVLNGSGAVPPGGWMSAQLTHAGAIFDDAHFGLRD